jgi:hypothetical protein
MLKDNTFLKNKIQKRIEKHRQKSGNGLVIASNDYHNGCQWLDNLKHFRYEKVGDGWFVNESQSEVTQSFIIKLSSKRNQERWLSGTTCPWNDGHGLVKVSKIHTEYEAAKKAAQNLSRDYSEECRECDEAFQRGMEAEELEKQISQNRSELDDLFPRRHIGDKVIQALLSREIKDLIYSIRRKSENAQKLRN